MLGLTGDEFAPVAAAEVDLAGEASGLPPRRFGVSVQVITEGGTRMGALVTLRDLDSLERISRQLQVSERLAALGRVTAGVAHEVKNPLNSMRLWLENLKECLPAGEEMPRQAVAVLDSEIDRLDSVVKRFLDFMRTPEMRLEETQLEELLREVAEVAHPQMDRAGVQLETSYADLPPLNVDRALIKQALLNLVLNAIEAMPQGGRLTLGAGAARRPGRDPHHRYRQGHRPGASRARLPTVLYNASGRQRHRTCERLSRGAVARWGD